MSEESPQYQTAERPVLAACAGSGNPAAAARHDGETLSRDADISPLTPYYQDAYCTIYHGDSLELLPKLPRAEMVLTDPPYCSGATESAKRGKRAAMTPESVTARPTIELDAMGSLGYAWVTRHWLLCARRVTIDGGHLACFTDWRMLPPLSTMVEAAGWRWNNTLVWDKGYPGLGAGFRAQHEMVIMASNGSPEWRSYEHGNVLKDMRLTKTEHPHQKPLGIISKILSTCTTAGGLVIDPYMGSGSTLVAAKQSGRRAIGMDLSEKHCETAARRLAQESFNFAGGDADFGVTDSNISSQAELLDPDYSRAPDAEWSGRR